MVLRNPRSTWGDLEIVSSQDYNTVPAVVRLNPDTGEVIGTTHLEGYGAFTKVVGDQNGDIVLGGSFFGQMFSDHDDIRSEEHTSELQSRENLVCRLLLEKKKRTSLDHRNRDS